METKTIHYVCGNCGEDFWLTPIADSETVIAEHPCTRCSSYVEVRLVGVFASSLSDEVVE